MFVEYVPVAGLTIEEAMDRALQTSKKQKCTVVTVLNDVVMFVNSNSNKKQLLNDYRDKVNLRYYTERIKRAKTK